MFFSPFLFVLLLVMGIPISKAIAGRIQRGGEGPAPDLLRRLKEEVEAAEARTLDSDKRMAELEDRVDFLEKLLQAPKGQATLPPPAATAPAAPPAGQESGGA